MSDLTDENFQVATINTFKELKETTYKDMKEGMMHQTPTFNKETEIIKEEQNTQEK